MSEQNNTRPSAPSGRMVGMHRQPALKLTPKQEAKLRALALTAHTARMEVVGVLRVQEANRAHALRLESELSRLRPRFESELRANAARISGEDQMRYELRQASVRAELDQLYRIKELEQQLTKAKAERPALFEKSSELNAIAAPLRHFIDAVLARAGLQRSDLGIHYSEDAGVHPA